MFEDIFKSKISNVRKLTVYGFVSKDGKWLYETNIMNDTFKLFVTVTEDGAIDTELIDIENDEPYVLYRSDASGAYVGKIRTEIEEVLTDIANTCFDRSVFKTKQAQMVIDHVHEAYGDDPEFLWAKFPDNAIWRRRDNKKWYGAVLTVKGRKLGLDTDKPLEIIDLRMDAKKKDEILSREHYYPGWHMNKNSWYTLILDECIPDEEIKLRIAESYELAKK